MRRKLARAFYDRDSLVVAPALLNKVLVVGGRSGRIVEVEAYRGVDDPASHAGRGPTPRSAIMFGPPGRLYVYFSYGMHWCANVVCDRAGVGSAVLIRALAPLTGVNAMRVARGSPRSERELCSGPAKLTQALGLDGAHNGIDLAARGAPVTIVDDRVAPPEDPVVTTRVGISVAVEAPWRWYVPKDPNVSRR